MQSGRNQFKLEKRPTKKSVASIEEDDERPTENKNHSGVFIAKKS